MPRIGSQEPTFCQERAYKETDGKQAALLASAFFGEPMEWQRRVLDGILARDGADKYMFHTVGISIPRQNGKSWDMRARCFYGIVTMGEKILYTCQHSDTADEMFKALSAPFEDEDNAELHGMLRAVRKTNGQQAIYLANGGVVRFTTRTNSLARGKSYDVLIYDEAQEMTRAQHSASLPTVSASKKKNTQTIYIGTPPDPTAPGEVFRPMHDGVHKGEKPNVLWYEWAADGIKDTGDRDWWYRCNPSLGLLVGETAIEGEAESFAPDDFARERLGWWVPERDASMDRIISAGEWDACATSESAAQDAEADAFGVKFSPDGGEVAIAVCCLAGGRPRVELAADMSTRNGTKWLREAMLAHARTPWLVDGKSGAQALLDAVPDMRDTARLASAADAAGAAGAFMDAVRERAIDIYSPGGDRLEESAKSTVKRAIGGAGGWGFGGDCAPIEACALALLAARRGDADEDMEIYF